MGDQQSPETFRKAVRAMILGGDEGRCWRPVTQPRSVRECADPPLGRAAPSRYRDPMQVYVFTSVSLPGVNAFTLDTTGGNLPPKYAPWLLSNDKAAMLIRAEI